MYWMIKSELFETLRAFSDYRIKEKLDYHRSLKSSTASTKVSNIKERDEDDG